MRLRTLLIGVFALVLAAIVARSILFAAMLGKIHGEALQALEARKSLDDLVSRAGRMAVDLETGVRGFMLTHEPEFRDPYDQARAAQLPLVADLAARVAEDPVARVVVERVASTLADWERKVASPLLAPTAPSPEATRALHVEGKHKMDAVRRDLETLRAWADARQAARLDALESRRRQLATEAVATTIAMIALLGTAWLVLRRNVERPITALAAYADRVARPGSLDGHVPPSNGVREVEELGAALDRMLARLAEQRAQLATTLDTLAEAVFVFDDQGVCTRTNPAARALLGRDILGEGLADLKGVLGAANMDGTPLEGPTSVEAATIGAGVEMRNAMRRIRTASGATRIVSQNAVAMRRDGVVVGAVVSSRDVTEEVELREKVAAANEELTAQNEELLAQDEELRVQSEELSRRNEELAQASRLKTEFLATMSHELRTPLNAVIGLSELLVAGSYGALGERPRTVLGDVHAAGLHLLALIDDLLDLSRIEAGHLALELQAFALAGAVREAVTLVTPAAARKSIEIQVLVPDDVLVTADRARVRQVALNLISNAVKFTPERGSIVVEARVDLRGGGEGVRVEVHDTGIGIKAVDVPRLFQPFSQLETGDGRRYGGTGLGLSISKRLIERMGGAIGHAARGRGSTFWFTLPRATELPSKPPVQAPRALPSGAALPRVLVVEDVGSDAAIVETSLASAGYAVTVVRDAERALAVLQDEVPALLVVDVGLPGMGGLALIQRVSEDARLAEVPIAILSARELSADERERLGERVRIVLRKGAPSRAEFLSKIGELVAPADRRAGRSVLVVDDNDVNRRVARAMVEAQGHGVLEAASGDEALRVARESRPDTILMDIQMPGMDGVEVLRALRASDETASIPVIAVTAHAMAGDAERFLESGFVAYVPKPIARTRLADALARALGDERPR